MYSIEHLKCTHGSGEKRWGISVVKPVQLLQIINIILQLLGKMFYYK